MQVRRYLYGMIGFLSLLGFIGVFSEERIFLAFFAFAVHFMYFFVKSDEMLEQYMNRSASRAFYCGMAVVAVVSLFCFFARHAAGGEALLTGFSAGWAVSIAVYALSAAYYGLKETWGLAHDKE